MIINKLTINNFLSFGPNNVIDLTNKGVTAIRGDNRDTGSSNGSGKSSIACAVLWTLFGDTVRKLKSVDDVINDQFGNNCFCSLEIENITVTRYRKHSTFGNSLKLYVDGVDKTCSDQKVTQKQINHLLNIEFNSFLSSIILTPDNKLNFLDDKNASFRRSIIEFILGIDLYKDYLFETKDCIKSIENNKQNLNAITESYKSQIQQYKKKLEELNARRQQFEDSRNKDIEELNKKLNILKQIDVNKQIKIHDYIKKAKELLIELNSKLLSFNKENMMKNAEIGDLLKDYEKYKNLTVKACGYCGSILDESKIRNIIDPISAKIERVKKSIEENKQKILELKNQYESIEKDMQRFKPELDEKDLYVIDSNIKNITASIESINKQDNPYSQMDFSESINSLNSEIESNNLKIEKSNDELKYYRFWETGFGNTGLKTYIIDDVIGFFNKRIEFYLDILSNCIIKLKFDKYLEFKINGLNYGSCSQGERRRVDLAVLLALHDLNNIRHNCQCNVLILDEVLDSVDEKGVECVKDVLLELSKTIPTILVISHNNTLLENFSNFITVVKENKISYVSPN